MGQEDKKPVKTFEALNIRGGREGDIWRIKNFFRQAAATERREISFIATPPTELTGMKVRALGSNVFIFSELYLFRTLLVLFQPSVGRPVRCSCTGYGVKFQTPSFTTLNCFLND